MKEKNCSDRREKSLLIYRVKAECPRNVQIRGIQFQWHLQHVGAALRGGKGLVRASSAVSTTPSCPGRQHLRGGQSAKAAKRKPPHTKIPTTCHFLLALPAKTPLPYPEKHGPALHPKGAWRRSWSLSGGLV